MDVTGVVEDESERIEDDNQALKDMRRYSGDQTDHYDQKSTKPNDVEQRSTNQGRLPLRKLTYHVETLTVLVSYASRFTVRDATSLHFSRLFDKGPFTCNDIEKEGTAVGVKVVDVTFVEPSRRRGSQQHFEQPPYLVPMPLEELPTAPLLLNSKSAVYFMYRKYKCVFCLDFSLSMLACHGGGEGVPVDRLADSLEICLKGLLTSKGGEAATDGSWNTQIYVSVIAHCEAVDRVWSLLQGYLLHPSTLPEAIQHIRHEILATETRFRHKLTEQQEAAQKWKKEEEEEPSNPINESFGLCIDDPPMSSSSPVTTRVEQITQKCGLALSFLPSDAAPLIVLLSDCIFERKESILYDGVVMQLCRNGTAVHGVQLVPVHDPLPNGMSGDGGLEQHHVKSSSSNAFNAFGYVPDGDAIRHLCSVTGGAFFPSMDNLKHATSIMTGAAILEQQEKKSRRLRSHSNDEPMKQNDVYRRKNSDCYSTVAATHHGTKEVLSLSPRLLTVFQHYLLTFISPLSIQSVSILESPSLHQAHVLDMMDGGHKRWRSNDKSIQGAAPHCTIFSTRPNIISSLLLGDAGRYTGDVRHEHVLSYALGRVHLRRLLEIRCSEGFRIVDWSLDHWAENSKPRRHSRKSSRMDGWGVGHQGRTTNRVRMTIAWAFGVRLDYLLDIQQLKFKDHSSSSFALRRRSIDVVAAVNLEITAGADFAKNVRKLRQQGVGGGGFESPTCISGSTSSAEALLEFVTTIKNVDVMLRQVLDFTLPSSDMESPLSLLSRRYNLSKGLPQGLKPMQSWLENLSFSEWHRCFMLESIEVIYKTGQPLSREMEDRIEDKDNILPSSPQMFLNSPNFTGLDDAQLFEPAMDQMAYIRPDSKEELLQYIFRTWSTMVLASGLFLKILSSHHDEECFPHSNRSPYVHFALLRVAWPLRNVATLHLACFACSSKERLELVDSLSGAIWREDSHVSISRLDVRDEESRRQQVYSTTIRSCFSKSSGDLESKKNEIQSFGKEPRATSDRMWRVSPTPTSPGHEVILTGGRKQFVHKINTNLHGCSTLIEFRLARCHEVRNHQSEHHHTEEYIPNWFYKHPSPSTNLLLTYFHRFTWLWRFGIPPRNPCQVNQALIHLRSTDGFDDMGLCSDDPRSALLAREVNVVLGVLDGESIHDGEEEEVTTIGVSSSSPDSGRLLMQYRIFWIDNDTLCTELLTEPQLGIVFVPYSSEEKAAVTSESKNGGEWMKIDDFKRDMARYMFESDYTTLTAINTFETVSQGGGIVPTAETPEEAKWRDRGKAENVLGEQNGPHTLLRVSLSLSLAHLLVHTSVNILPLQMFHMPFEDDCHLFPCNISSNSSSAARNLLSLPEFCTTCFSNQAVALDWGVRPLTEKDAEGGTQSFGSSGNSHGRRGGEEQIKRKHCGHFASKDLYSMLIKSLSKLNEAELPLHLNFFEGGRKGDNTPSLCFHYEPLGYLPQGVAERGHWFFQPNQTCEDDDAILLTFLPRFQDWMAQWRQYEIVPKLENKENSQVILCRGCYTALDTEGGGGVNNKGMVRATGSLSNINEFYKTTTKEDATTGDDIKKNAKNSKELLNDPYTTRFLPPSLGVFVCEVKTSDFGMKYKFPVGELFSRVKSVFHGRGFLRSSTSKALFTSNDQTPLQSDQTYSSGQSGKLVSKEQSPFQHVPQLQCSYCFEDKSNTTFLKVLNHNNNLSNVIGKQEKYIRSIDQIHRLASAKSMYHALRNGASVCAGDFKRILKVCEELEASLDVSILSSTKLEAQRTGRERLKSSSCGEDMTCGEADDFDQRFSELLTDHFGPIKPRTGYYAYLHGAEFIGEAAHTRDEQTELFLKIPSPKAEVRIKRDFHSFTSDASNNSSTLPHLTVLTTAASGAAASLGDWVTDDPNNSNPPLDSSGPEKILHEIFPPMLVRFELRRLSKGGKLIQCTPLSETMGFSEALLQTEVENSNEDYRTFLFMFLSTFLGVASAQTLSLQKELISTVLSNIDVLTIGEVLRSLLDVTPVTLEGLHLVKNALSPLPPSEVLQFCVPVHLVSLPKPDQRVESAGNKAHLVNIGWDLLRCELLKGTSSLITFQRIGDYVIVVEPYPDGTEGYKVPYWAFLSVMDNNQAAHELHSDNISPKIGNSPGNQAAPSNINTVTLFAHATIHLPSLLPGVLDTLRETICQAVVEAVKVVNQRLLLHSLHKTKYASSLLIPSNSELQQHSNPSAPTGSSSMSAEDQQQLPSGSSEMKKLLAHQENDLSPGCFSCSLKFRCQFPLYHRIRDQALERLQAAALEGFLIANRCMMYVYRDSSGSIFYLSLAKEVISGVVGPHEKGEKEKSFLVLLAYGVDEVGDDVVIHLTRVIEQKLAECSYNFLSFLLERNPKFHLTPLDLEVVKLGGNSGRGLEAASASCDEVGGDDNINATAGGSSGGRETAYLLLPKSIMDVPLFFLYLRQLMCAGELVNPLFTTKPETELTEGGGGGNNAVVGVVDFHHHNDRATDGLGCSTKRLPLSRLPLPSMAEESDIYHDIYNSNNTDLLPRPRPYPSDGVLWTRGQFTFYINPSVSGLGPVTQCSARSIGKGIAIIHLSPINMDGKVEWDFPSNTMFEMTNFASLVGLKKQCENEIRSLEEEVLDPLNSCLIFNPDFVSRSSLPQVNTTTSSSSGGGMAELDLEYKSSSISSCTPSCDAATCDTEGQQGGDLASRQHLRTSSPSFLKNGSTNQCGIRIEVDACGTIDLPNLLNLIERHIDQALVDYWIERILLLTKINSIMCNEETSTDSGIEALTISPPKHTLKNDGLYSSSVCRHLPEDHQEYNIEVICCCCPPLPLLQQSSSNPNSFNGLQYVQQTVQHLGSRKDGSDQNQTNDCSKQHHTKLRNIEEKGYLSSSSQQHVPHVNTQQLCGSLGKLLRAGEHLGNPTIRRVYLCHVLPNWALSRVLKDSILALSSCFQVPLDMTLLRFDMNGSCEVVKTLDVQTMRMMSRPEQPPKSFVGFFGLHFPNCEYQSSIGQYESEQQSSPNETESLSSHMKSPSISSFTSSSGTDLVPEMTPAFFPWAMMAEQVKEAESSLTQYSMQSSIDEGSFRCSTSEKSKIGLDELFKHDHVVLQRRVFLVLHLSSRAQSLEVYNLHHVHAERVCEALFSVMSAAKLQMLALEHVVCQNAGRAPPFTSLYPRKCNLVEDNATTHHVSKQHHIIKLSSRLNPMKQGRTTQSTRHIQAIALYPEIWKCVVSNASTDSMAFSSKLWGMVIAERVGGGTKFGCGSTTTVPGSSQLKSSTEGEPTRDLSNKSIVAAAAAARHRGRPSSARIAALSGGGSGGGGVHPLSQLKKSSGPSSGPMLSTSSSFPSSDNSATTETNGNTGDKKSSIPDLSAFLISPSLGGRSAWRRHVRSLHMSPMSLSLHYDHHLGHINSTSTAAKIITRLPIIPIAKQMETLQCAVAEEKIEAQSLSKMIPFTWEGLQTLRWTKSKKKSTTTYDAAVPSSQQQQHSNNNNKNTEEVVDESIKKHDTILEKCVWSIPNATVAESLAKNARLLDMIIFPLPMYADTAFQHHYPPSSFDHHESRSGSSSSLGCPSCSLHHCDCDNSNTKEDQTTTTIPLLSRNNVLSSSILHETSMHGNNEHREEGTDDSHHVTREVGVVGKTGLTTTGLLTGGLFDLLQKKWGHKYPFRKLVLASPPQVCNEGEMEKNAYGIHQYPTESATSAADRDKKASTLSLTSEDSSSNLISDFPTLRSVTKSSLNHIALGRAVFVSPIVLSSTLLLLDIELDSNSNDNNLNNGGSRLPVPQGHHQLSLAHCRLFSVDVSPPPNNNLIEDGQNLCCRGLSGLATFSWFAPPSPLLPQIPVQIAEARKILNLGDDLHDHLLESVRAKILSSGRHRSSYLYEGHSLLADLRILAQFSKLEEESGRSRMGCHFHIYCRELATNGPCYEGSLAKFMCYLHDHASQYHFQPIGKSLITGGIAKNHDSNSCGHHTGNDDPESAAIVTFALSLPLSNEESGSSNDIALDMFLLVKNPAMSSDLELVELVDSVTSYLQEVLAAASCDFRRDIMWKRLTEEMKLNSNIMAGDEGHPHSSKGLHSHFNPSVTCMNDILEHSAVEDIRKWEPIINKIFDIGLGTSWQEWFRCLQRSKDICTVCWSEPLNVPKCSEEGTNLLCSFHIRWDKVALRWRSAPSMTPGVFILVSLSTKGGTDLVTIHLVRRVNEATLNAEQVECLSAFVTYILIYAALGPTCVALKGKEEEIYS